MKLVLLLLSCFGILWLNAQQNKERSTVAQFKIGEKYISFNPFGIAEPHMAIGLGFGKRFTARSEYFSELSFVTLNPMYDPEAKCLNGARFLAQYRYHFLQQWKPLINLSTAVRERKARQNPFIGLEFRMKTFDFSANRTFIKKLPADTLGNYLYNANAISIGGALLFGATCNISSNKKWKIEITAGVGGKIKIIHYKNLPQGYEPIINKGGFGLAPPVIDEPVGMPYFPFALRLRYCLD